eukprot:5996791-Amphidinium_carterae.1
MSATYMFAPHGVTFCTAPMTYALCLGGSRWSSRSTFVDELVKSVKSAVLDLVARIVQLRLQVLTPQLHVGHYVNLTHCRFLQQLTEHKLNKPRCRGSPLLWLVIGSGAVVTSLIRCRCAIANHPWCLAALIDGSDKAQ